MGYLKRRGGGGGGGGGGSSEPLNPLDLVILGQFAVRFLHPSGLTFFTEPTPPRLTDLREPLVRN